MGGATDRASHWPAACMTFSRHCWSPLKVLSSVAAPGMARTCVQFASVSVCHSTTGFLCTQCKQAGQRRLCTSASVARGRGADRRSGRPAGQGGRGRADQDGCARVGRLQHPVQCRHIRLHRHAADVRQGRRRVHLRGRPEGARGLARGPPGSAGCERPGACAGARTPGTARVAMRQAARVWASCGRPKSLHLRIGMSLARHEFRAACVAQDCSGRSSGLVSTCTSRQIIAAAVHLGQLHPVRLRALQRLKRLRCLRRLWCLRRLRRTGWSWPNGTAAALSCLW